MSRLFFILRHWKKNAYDSIFAEVLSSSVCHETGFRIFFEMKKHLAGSAAQRTIYTYFKFLKTSKYSGANKNRKVLKLASKQLNAMLPKVHNMCLCYGTLLRHTRKHDKFR